MRLFEVQTDLISYKYSAIKALASILVVLLCVFRRHFLSASMHWVNTIASLISYVLTILCILVLYISIGELFHTYVNRKQSYAVLGDTVIYMANDVLDLVQKEDIIEFEIFSTKGMLKVGSASDNAYADSSFFDKVYYIGDYIYRDITIFRQELLSLSSDNQLYIYSIDGNRVKDRGRFCVNPHKK